ncbi:MAG: hypothetical protein QOJ99_32 [Bryobacterales bacterium]|jgi:hypothetical protein|nr:hypothetical protein [Bryobacterales bacterium]
MRIITVIGLTLAGLFSLSTVAPAASPQDEAREIVRRSVKADTRNEALRRDYTYKVLNVFREPGPARTELFEVLSLGGSTYRHLLERNGQPLPPEDARKEQERLDFAIQEKKKLSDNERNRGARKSQASRAREREMFQHIPEAFDFSPLGETEINGRGTWIIAAAPKRDYNGKASGFLRHTEGTLWIDKQDYQWVKVEARALDTISLGWFLARIAKGTRISLENIRVNDEIWAPKRVAVHGSARLALVKKISADQEHIYSDYRKFQTDSRMVSAEDSGNQ